jgi:hypothetical protein
MSPRVVRWNNIPSPYAAPRLDAVAARANVTLEAWFCYRSEPDPEAVNEDDLVDGYGRDCSRRRWCQKRSFKGCTGARALASGSEWTIMDAKSR